MELRKRQGQCRGCWNDFEGSGPGCRRYAKAKAVRRLALAWDADPTVEENYAEIVVLDCWAAPGRIGLFSSYPTCVNLSPKDLK
jgi:hypothetical protein